MYRYTRLKRHRKRSGFTQKELGFLLGDRRHDSAISRYEAGERTPGLKIALAYKLLFGSDLRELFPGAHAQVAAELRERARLLSEEIRRGGMSRKSAYKLEKLARLQNEGLENAV